MYNDNINNFYTKLCHTLYRVCYDPIGTHKKVRAAIGFFLGFSLALVFYVTIIIDLDLKPLTTVILGAIVCIMMSVGCSSSIQVRCVCLLTIPAFLGRAGRSLLKALVLGYIIAGPIFNLTYNGKEVVRTFACTTQLAYNLTKTRSDLMLQPFHQAILGMKQNSNDMRDTFASVKDLISPITKEMEDENEMNKHHEENDYLDDSQNNIKRPKHKIRSASPEEFYELKYRKKIGARCEEQLNRGSERCRDMFHDMYDKCYDSVTWFAAWLLCWPMKLTFICNIVQALGGSNICDPENKVDSGIGDGYVSLKESQDKLSGELKDARIQYKVNIAPPLLDVNEASDTAQAVLHEFDVRRKLFDSTMTILKRCLAFVFLKIIHSAQRYHDNYLTNIEHDNHYITSYFRKIDQRRKVRGSMTLLPLKKIERKILVDSHTIIPSTLEKKYLIGHTVKLILEMITATTILLLDMLFFEVLDLVRRHGYVEYSQAGYHDVKLDVRGTGIISAMISNLIRGFKMKKRVNLILSNGECLPLPNKLNHHILIKIYGTYLAIWLMILLASYFQRLKCRICEYFYVKRQKRRILYLYNETLRRRVGYIRFMKNKIKKLVRQRRLERDMNPWTALTIDSPYWFGWLRFFAFARQKCLVCGESEPRKNSDFHICTTPGCFFIHCPECWQDIGNICFACADLPPSDTESDTDHDDNDIKSVNR